MPGTMFDREAAGNLAGEPKPRARRAHPLDPTSRAPAADDALVRLAGLGSIVGEVAHQLNNPLMGVVNHVQYAKLKANSDPSKSAEALEAALGYTQRCINIVKELLPYARSGIAGLIPPRLSAKVDATVAEALQETHGMARRAGASIQVEMERGLPEVPLPTALLREVLVELLRNAFEALAGAERRSLIVRAYSEQDAVLIEVRDSGAGIDAEVLPRVFEPLFSTRRDRVGRGVGLAMSKNIVESAGGSIHARSAEGCGAVFTVTLPSRGHPGTSELS